MGSKHRKNIFAIIIAVALSSKILFEKKPSPILMILFSAVLGMLMYGI